MTATFKPRQSIVYLFQGDDLDPIVEKLKNVETIAVNSATQRLGDPGPVATATADYDGFMDGARARAIQVELHALGRKKYQALRNEHPVRMVEDPDDTSEPKKQMVHEDDREWGFNFDEFGDALLLAWDDAAPVDPEAPAGTIHGSLTIARVFSDTDDVAPVITTRAELEQWLDLLSDSEFSALYGRAVQLNEGSLPDPKARFSTLLEQTSGETSESPARLA